MTRLSVIVPTNRVGGLDVLFAGLRGQTFKDFDLWVVDELGRVLMITTAWRDFPAACTGPKGVPGHWGNYMASLNAGLRASTGDRLVFWSDYTCPHPETLATHARFHAENPDAVMLGGIEYTELPRLHPDFPLRYGWLAMGHDVANHRDETYAPWLDHKRRHELCEEWRQAYERDIDAGTLDPFMWSVFESPVNSFAEVAGLRVFNHDRRDTSPFLNLKNDSIPRSLLEKIGGFDERADGTHGHQDSITARQLTKVGARMVSVPENPVRLLDPHGVALVRSFRDGKDDTSNLKIYEGAV
jgi:hypothetical protein